MHELQKRLGKDDSVANIVKISNSIAYHVNNLNKLLARKSMHAPEEGENLAQIIPSS